MSSSSATNSSLSSFSDECETSLPDPPPPPIPHAPAKHFAINDCVSSKKPVHKIEPVFNHDTSKMRIFLEDGSLTEYSIGDLTTAADLVEEVAFRHSLGSDTRRYRLTLSEAQDTSWRSIRYIRPQQKLKEVISHVSKWSSTTMATICTLRVVIVPYQAEALADTEPVTFTYLYRQSINDYVRERVGSEMSIDTAVKLTALLILDESLCTGIRVNTLVKRSWLLRQLLPRSLLDQFSLKQLINRIRTHLNVPDDITQLNVAKQFIRIFSENTRSFAGKLFPVKFPDKHRDSILLVGSRHPVAILDQARRANSPVITLVSAWSHLSRVVVKQYRNGVAIRLYTTPRTTTIATATTTATDDSSILQQEISFLIHTNLLNDLMAFIEGYSQLESSNFPLSIERISHISKSPSSIIPKSKPANMTHESLKDTARPSPFIQRILNNRKNHRTYILPQEKRTLPTSPTLFEITRQFFARDSPVNTDMDERETISNVPNRTTLVTWRSIVDNQASGTPPPPPIFYRTIINVKHTEEKTVPTTSDEDDEPDVIDFTTSNGYYGTLSFPIRPPSPFADGLIWSEISNQTMHEDENTDGIVVWTPSTNQLTIHCNTNNSNNNHLKTHSPEPSRTDHLSWKHTLDRILKRNKSRKACPELITTPYNFGAGENSSTSTQPAKRVHFVDNNLDILNACRRFVDSLKIFIQSVINGKQDKTHEHLCQTSLNELSSLVDCSELTQAFEKTVQLSNNDDKSQLLQQQTIIAHLISRTILSS